MTFGVLAAAAPASGNVTPGVLGFLVVAAMGVALVFLLRSMNKQFRKITPEAEGAAPNAGQGAGRAKGTEPGQNETPARETPA